MQELIVGLIIATYVAMLGGIGYIIRRAEANGKATRDGLERIRLQIAGMEDFQDRYRDDRQQLRVDINDQDKRLGKLEEILPTMRVSLATIVREFEIHQDWHDKERGERHG